MPTMKDRSPQMIFEKTVAYMTSYQHTNTWPIKIMGDCTKTISYDINDFVAATLVPLHNKQTQVSQFYIKAPSSG
jgi:hypothetical protein